MWVLTFFKGLFQINDWFLNSLLEFIQISRTELYLVLKYSTENSPTQHMNDFWARIHKDFYLNVRSTPKSD